MPLLTPTPLFLLVLLPGVTAARPAGTPTGVRGLVMDVTGELLPWWYPETAAAASAHSADRRASAA
eukprot:scaffold89099_cov20-Tisochrysis_lutea.AAC.1